MIPDQEIARFMNRITFLSFCNKLELYPSQTRLIL